MWTLRKENAGEMTAYVLSIWLFHDGGPYHIETSILICSANKWTGFYMIGTPVVERVNFSDTLRSNLEAKYRKIFQDFQGLLLSYY